MPSQEFAARFANEWIDAWNAHDLPRILEHYADDFEMSSPYIAQLLGEPTGALKGKAAVDSVILYYRGARGMAAEVFFYDVGGKVVKSCAHYA